LEFNLEKLSARDIVDLYIKEGNRLPPNQAIYLLKRAIDLKNDIKMVYYPIINNLGVKEGNKRLTSFGGNYTMYLRISTITEKPL